MLLSSHIRNLGCVGWLLFALACQGEEENASNRRGKAAEQATPIGMVLAPEHAVVSMGASLSMEAIGLYDGRVTRDLTNAVVWHVSDADIASISNGLDKEGVLTPHAVGLVEVMPSTSAVSVAQPPGPMPLTGSQGVIVSVGVPGSGRKHGEEPQFVVQEGLMYSKRLGNPSLSGSPFGPSSLDAEVALRP